MLPASTGEGGITKGGGGEGLPLNPGAYILRSLQQANETKKWSPLLSAAEVFSIYIVEAKPHCDQLVSGESCLGRFTNHPPWLDLLLEHPLGLWQMRIQDLIPNNVQQI